MEDYLRKGDGGARNGLIDSSSREGYCVGYHSEPWQGLKSIGGS
jgi:hypothetical protein